jgi:multiple sugar transport system ATP-binding protein
VHYGIRPTDLTLSDSGVQAKVIVVEPTGAETELLLQVGEQRVTVVTHGRTRIQPDDVVHLNVATDKVHVFDGASGQRI